MTKHTPPRIIYLQEWDSPDYEGTTWCIDKIHSGNEECECEEDATYIRKDIADDLLEALEELVNLIDDWVEGYPEAYLDSVTTQPAHKLIAKAKGE